MPMMIPPHEEEAKKNQKIFVGKKAKKEIIANLRRLFEIKGILLESVNTEEAHNIYRGIGSRMRLVGLFDTG